MSADPEQLRTQIDALLAELPSPGSDGDDFGPERGVDLDEVASSLEAAHEILVHALESVEKG